jgi:hypothetical protein
MIACRTTITTAGGCFPAHREIKGGDFPAKAGTLPMIPKTQGFRQFLDRPYGAVCIIGCITKRSARRAFWQVRGERDTLKSHWR